MNFSMRVRLPTAIQKLGANSRLLCVPHARCSTYGENDVVNPNFENHNPRNMEMLRLARKRKGWCLQSSTPRYWYKLILEQSNRHTIGRVEHHTGTTVVSASTQEWAIKQHLYTTIDASAVYNIGRVLARRCLEAGITEVYSELEKASTSSVKIQLFMSAIKEGGVVPEEPDFIHERSTYMWEHDKAVFPWRVQEEEVCAQP